MHPHALLSLPALVATALAPGGAVSSQRGTRTMKDQKERSIGGESSCPTKTNATSTARASVGVTACVGEGVCPCTALPGEKDKCSPRQCRRTAVDRPSSCPCQPSTSSSSPCCPKERNHLVQSQQEAKQFQSNNSIFLVTVPASALTKK